MPLHNLIRFIFFNHRHDCCRNPSASERYTTIIMVSWVGESFNPFELVWQALKPIFIFLVIIAVPYHYRMYCYLVKELSCSIVMVIKVWVVGLF
jgi:hypothetical protein